VTQDWPADFANLEELRKRSHIPRWRVRLFAIRDLVASTSEFAALLTDPVFWSHRAARGNGAAVLVLPGYSCTDLHTFPLRNWLRRNGFWPSASGIARMPAWSEETVDILRQRAEALSREVSGPITIVGHSIGAVFGWSIARRIPQVVRHLVVLGAPLGSANGRLPESVAITSIIVRVALRNIAIRRRASPMPGISGSQALTAGLLQIGMCIEFSPRSSRFEDDSIAGGETQGAKQRVP
jgi:pimeloyl-ACP methyl ester carboxylesterase